MAVQGVTLPLVPLGRILLNRENPRHDQVASEGAAIEKLCNKEEILAIAGDIVENGMNPLDITGLLPIESKKSSKELQTFIVMEGNRRICALKVLNDPELAPAKLRKSFENLANGWTPIKAVPAVIFANDGEARLWMRRIHNGPQGGMGRKNWDSDQKTRFDGGSKNKIAQTLLDYAEQSKMLSSSERKRKLTTAQRFISNEIFRENLGLDHNDPDDLKRTRLQSDFDIILRAFVRDLVNGKEVNSRMNKKEIIDYSRQLSGLSGVTSTRIEPESIFPGSTGKGKRRGARKAPQKPKRPAHIQHQSEIHQALRTLGNEKLQSLYHSICSIELEHHTPLVCVGVWSFFETATACAGRHENTNFEAFLSKNRISGYGITGNTQPLRTAIGRIHEYGNTTKHHEIAATFNGDQL